MLKKEEIVSMLKVWHDSTILPQNLNREIANQASMKVGQNFQSSVIGVLYWLFYLHKQLLAPHSIFLLSSYFKHQELSFGLQFQIHETRYMV